MSRADLVGTVVTSRRAAIMIVLSVVDRHRMGFVMRASIVVRGTRGVVTAVRVTSFDLFDDGDLRSLGDGDAKSFTFSFAASNPDFALIVNFFVD